MNIVEEMRELKPQINEFEKEYNKFCENNGITDINFSESFIKGLVGNPQEELVKLDAVIRNNDHYLSYYDSRSYKKFKNLLTRYNELQRVYQAVTYTLLEENELDSIKSDEIKKYLSLFNQYNSIQSNEMKEVSVIPSFKSFIKLDKFGKYGTAQLELDNGEILYDKLYNYASVVLSNKKYVKSIVYEVLSLLADKIKELNNMGPEEFCQYKINQLQLTEDENELFNQNSKGLDSAQKIKVKTIK